jgi:hypothetical protein
MAVPLGGLRAEHQFGSGFFRLSWQGKPPCDSNVVKRDPTTTEVDTRWLKVSFRVRCSVPC